MTVRIGHATFPFRDPVRKLPVPKSLNKSVLVDVMIVILQDTVHNRQIIAD